MHDNPSDSFREMSLQTTNVRMNNMNGCAYDMGIHPVVVEIFQPGPKWWTDPQVDNVLRVMLLCSATITANI